MRPKSTHICEDESPGFGCLLARVSGVRDLIERINVNSQLFDLDKVLQELGDTSDWEKPDGYPNSLALCVIDSIWSIGIRYSTVIRVLHNYLDQRGFRGKDARFVCTDGTSEFLQWYRALNDGNSSPKFLSRRLKNRNLTSSRNGKLKAEAVVQAFELFESLGVENTTDLLSRSEEIESRWLSEIHGQSSGVSWKYLLMLCGQSGVKPDRMLLRFMARVGVNPKSVSPEEFVHQIVKEIGAPHIDATAVDHRIWSIERQTRRRRT